MNNDVTIFKIHMLVLLTMQHHVLQFQNDVINVAVFQANLKKEVKSDKPCMRVKDLMCVNKLMI